MSGDDFSDVFGGRPAQRPSFAERVARPDGAPVNEPAEVAAGSGAYKPFGFLPAGHGESCDVQSWNEHTQTPEGLVFQYRFLTQIAYTGDEELRLMLPDSIVVVEGQHLRELRQKLARRQVTFIQQYLPLIWPRPNQGEPVVERIEVVRPSQPVRSRSG